MFEVYTTSTEADDSCPDVFPTQREAEEYAREMSREDLLRGYLVYQGGSLIAEWDRGEKICV
jgi:hypothetical protein